MPPKKRNSVAAQNKALKPGAERASPDKKESPDLSAKKDKDAEFVTLCKSLQVTDVVCDRAWSLWKTVQESMDGVSDSQKRLWGACLFVTVTDLDVPCFTLSQVLKAVSLNLKQFMALVRKLDVNLDTINTKVDSVMTRLEKKYDVTLALYQRFEKTCKRIFALVADDKEREIMRSCWTMFLLAKGRVLQMEDDLVISFQLLLCTLELFIKRCPPDLLQPLYKSAIGKVQSQPTRTSRRNQSKAKSRPPEPEVEVQLLETLCKENECNAEEVKNVYQTSFSAFLDSLDLSRSSDFPPASDIDQQYEEHYLKSRDIDGRLFFDGDETVLLPKVEVSQVERTPKKHPPDDDAVLIPPQTPIRAAMTSIQQLRGDLISSGDQPSTTLNTYFKNCTVDPTQNMLTRLETLEQLFSQRFGQAVGPRCLILGKQRFALGVRLYYKIMEAMLKSEEKRLSVQNFSKLLNDATFHTSLLACALEVVMATYGGLDLLLLLLRKLLSRGHTHFPDSPLFELLKQEHEGGAVEQVETPASFSQPLQHNHTAADLYLSPVRPGHRVLPPESPAPANSQASTQAPNQPANQTPRQPKSNSLSLFYKKLYRLAYTRLEKLCTYLLSSHPELEPIIWTLFQHTLQHEYELMRDRHLDQLMMSAMYAICKVKSVDLRFKTIVTEYKNMPNTNQETFKHVLITEAHYDSIIVFYNQVFMQRLKTNILQYASPRPPTLSPIPQIPRSPYKFPNSPLRVPGSNNVYISPLKNPRMSPGIMTPRSRMLVSIGESFGRSSRFREINQMVNSSERSFKRTLDLSSAPKPLKRLRFDVDGQDEADGSKSGRDSTLIQKLAEMSSTRSRMQEQKLKEDAEARKE
ncbi:retinoblastoma-associated protein [Solea senegalensis]|uniref:Retinoblastoma-associated protein n=1 Tax=Solea senegalensis TaxID=28829 RepID=A0AAV6SFZ3_SOLSE|nr:retinoblastoma-associated protein [Solea senegalensis]